MQSTSRIGFQGERSDDRIPNHERVCEDLVANESSYGYKWETQVSKFVSKLVRHENSRERETDGAIHWKFKSPKLRFKFRSDGGSNFTDRDWINFIWKGSNRTKFQYCQNSCNKLLYIRTIQGHTRRRNDSTRDAGHVLILPNWKEFVFHRGCWLDSPQKGEMVVKTDSTAFFTPLNPWCTEEEYCDDLTMPRKVQHKTGWKHSQNAVYLIHLGRAQEKESVLANQIACSHHIQHGAT